MSLGPNASPVGSPTFLQGIDASISIISSALFDAESVEVPGLYLFQEALKILKNCVDDSKAQGNSVCPNFLPACQYAKGILVMLLESHGYWEAKMSGQRPGCCVKDMELPTVTWASNNTTTQYASINRRPQNAFPTGGTCISVVSHLESEDEMVEEEMSEEEMSEEISEQSFQGKR